MFLGERQDHPSATSYRSAPRRVASPTALDPIYSELDSGACLGRMVGRSPVSRRLFAQIRATAPHATIASFEGEAGTGKLLAARTFHELSPASPASFVPCLAEKFFESPMQALLDESDGGTRLERQARDRRNCRS